MGPLKYFTPKWLDKILDEEMADEVKLRKAGMDHRRSFKGKVGGWGMDRAQRCFRVRV